MNNQNDKKKNNQKRQSACFIIENLLLNFTIFRYSKISVKETWPATNVVNLVSYSATEMLRTRRYFFYYLYLNYFILFFSRQFHWN